VGAGSFTYVIENPAVGTYVVEEYAEAAGTLTHLTDRWTGTSIGYRVADRRLGRARARHQRQPPGADVRPGEAPRPAAAGSR
jgi:hypothetical protein